MFEMDQGLKGLQSILLSCLSMADIHQRIINQGMIVNERGEGKDKCFHSKAPFALVLLSAAY